MIGFAYNRKNGESYCDDVYGTSRYLSFILGFVVRFLGQKTYIYYDIFYIYPRLYWVSMHSKLRNSVNIKNDTSFWF
jgi:hypothetical protein